LEELYELRLYIEHGQYARALNLVGEMEEMSRDDKINKISSFIEILLLHLIKQKAEKRTTKSWEASIKNSVRQIKRVNKRKKAGGYYLDIKEIVIALEEAWDSALTSTSLEAFEGRYKESELAKMIDEEKIKQKAIDLICQEQEKK